MSSSSFFLKSKPKSAKKRKVCTNDTMSYSVKSNLLFNIFFIFQIPLENKFTKNEKFIPKKPEPTEDDDEIHSSDEDDEQFVKDQSSDENESDEETPQDKRLKLAKVYLEEIEKEEQSRAEDEELLENNVSRRLANEYLDSVGKLRRKIADNFTGYDETNLKYFKHKLHQLPVTCVCLTSDNKFLFTGNKSAIVLKWDFEKMQVVGHIDCNKGKSIDEVEHSKKKRRPQTYALAITTDSKFLVSLFIFYIFKSL